jgi:hypothetical protein
MLHSMTSGVLPSDFVTKIYSLLTSLNATLLTHLTVLDLTILVIFGEEYKLMT